MLYIITEIEKPTVKNRLGFRSDLDEKLGFTCDIDEKLEKAKRAMKRLENSVQQAATDQNSKDTKPSGKSSSIWNRRTWDGDSSKSNESTAGVKPILRRIGEEKGDQEDGTSKKRQGWRRTAAVSNVSSTTDVTESGLIHS